MSTNPDNPFTAKAAPRLTPGEIAMGVTFEEKDVDPADQGPRTDLNALTADNASAHGGLNQTQQNALAAAGVPEAIEKKDAQIVSLQQQLADAGGQS